jgi:predicted Holliday junction resolvase-like endonuclease
MELELLLIWAVIATMVLLLSFVALIKLKNKHKNQINELQSKLETKQKSAYQMGVNTSVGDYSEILGDFALLSKYDQIITLSTTSKAPSLDLIGVSEESLDFIEIKKKGATLSKSENNIRRLVEEKKISYKVFDVELPKGITVEERKLRERKKIKEK